MIKSIYIKYITFVVFILLLAACSTPKDYTAAEMDLPEKFQLPDSVSKNLDTVLISRETLFKDSVLVQLIDQAFENNFDVRTIDKDIEINDEYFKQSKAAFYTELNLNLLGIEKEWKIGRASCR